MIEIKPIVKIVKDILANGMVEDSKSYIASIFNELVYVKEGMLLFNTLTKQLLLLNEYEKNEYFHFDKNSPFGKFLVENHFFVSKGTNEIEIVDNIRTIIKALKKSNIINKYTIMTTTDCNARCFYCYELGRSRIPMSENTAKDLVDFIDKHHGNKVVTLAWFGGEPLYNNKVIDLITDGLKERNIKYISTMTSNGYLFDSECVKKAKEKWLLQRVQISLDGTEEVYNRCKAYIYKNTASPYNIVLGNIEKLLDADIAVNIRLNMEKHNIDNLYNLVDDLSNRFNRKQRLRIYVARLFNNDVDGSDNGKLKADGELIDKQIDLIKYIDSKGLLLQSEVANKFKIKHCMADDLESVVVAPDGNIGRCEHYSENEFIGSIYNDVFDKVVINKWCEKSLYDECKGCVHYPECLKLNHCPDFPNYCSENDRKIKTFWLDKSMLNSYMIYDKLNNESDEKSDL